MRDIIVVLVRCDGPINLGAVARLCSNHEVSLRLVEGAADPQHADAVKMAMHGQHLLRSTPYRSVRDAVGDVDASFGFSAKAHAARESAFTHSYARAHVVGRIALVFGNEMNGLNQDERNACTHAVHLQLDGDSSMNLSHAVAAALALCPQDESTKVADHPQRQALLSSWNEMLTAAGYYQRSSAEAFAPRLRAMIDRMQLTGEDADLLQSMMAVVRHGRDRHNRE